MAQPSSPTAAPALAWARRQRQEILLRLAVTPGRLRLAAVLLILGALLFGVLAAGATSSRSQAAESVAKQTEPLLVQVQGLYVSLSDADATASTTFLTGGLEPPARRAHYERDLRVAAGNLTMLTQDVGTPGQASAAVRVIAQQLPVYGGLIEAARANNRQGFPVGAAYLRQASTLMREKILPAASRLYDVEARRLNSDYSSGTSTGTLLVAIVVALAMLALLVGQQVYLSRLTHRTLNVYMVAGTAVLVVLTAWIVVGFVIEQNRLASAQRTGSDSVEVLAAARILALRAQDDESLALDARGSGEQDIADFNTAIRRLGGPNGRGGLLGEATAIAARNGSTAAMAKLATDFVRYRSTHRRVVALETGGKFADAVRLAVRPRAREVPLASDLNAGLEQQIGAAQHHFADSADSAMAVLSGLWLAIPLLTVAFAALAFYGILKRINEYR